MNSNCPIQIERDAQDNLIISGRESSAHQSKESICVIQQTTRVLDARASFADTLTWSFNPYFGLSAFREQDANYFFGREQLTTRVWQKFRNLHSPINNGKLPLRLLSIIGPAGSGKSSLARAGLIPELVCHSSFHVKRSKSPQLRYVVVMTPGEQPLKNLAKALARIVPEKNAKTHQKEEYADLLKNHNGLQQINDNFLPDTQIIILVDQFEECYSLCTDLQERTAFIKNLLFASGDKNGQISVILTLRSDFLEETQSIPLLYQAISKYAVIMPLMTKAEIQRAISEPAKLGRRPLDPELENLLIQEASGREGSLPLLQFTLTRLWDAMNRGISPMDKLKQFGGVGMALAYEADYIYTRLSEEDKQIAQQLFLKLVKLEENSGRDVCQRIAVDELIKNNENGKRIEKILHYFSRPETRLITFSHASAQTTVEIAHKVVLTRWPTLKQWITIARQENSFKNRLEEVAHGQNRRKKRTGLLWKFSESKPLKSFYQGHRHEMTALEEQKFFGHSNHSQEKTIHLGRFTFILFLGFFLWFL